MKNLKKVIASICVIAMMLTTVAFAATYSDVADDSAYYEAVETLNKLGIVTGYEDGTYKPEDGVTRAEMAALIARIQGFGDTAAAQSATAFTDVPASHWASGYVANAAASGIINGKGNGIFDPEANVLFEEAVKMVMATLGYTPYAEYNGGYPGGYMAAAQRYNVISGVANATMGTNANRGTIAQLLANAIDTPLMQQTGWNTNGEVEYKIYDGKDNELKTLMSENLGVVKVRGTVTSNAYTDITADKEIDLEEAAAVEIAVVDAYDTTHKDFKDYNDLEDEDAVTLSFLVGESDAADFLGYSVIAYVQEADDEWEIVSIVKDTTRNDELTIDLSQFNQVNDKFEYYKSATAKTATAVKLAEDPAVVYNNAYYAEGLDIFGDIVENNGETKDGGKITLIDNNDEKGYDVIFVEVAETAVVDKAEEGFVAFKDETARNYIPELEVDEDDTDRVVKVTKDGEEIALADLAEWDVLSVIAAADDANYILAEVVSNQVIGTVSSMSNSSTSADGKAYKIDGAKYDIAAGAYDADAIEVGVGGVFYIDKYGKIAAFNEDAALASGVAANYAYVTAVAFDEDILTGKETAIIQMVTADGVVALNLKATGAKLNKNAVDVDDADDQAALEAIVGEVVTYAKNAANNITSINEVDEDDDVDGGMYEEAVAKEFDAEDARLINSGNVYVAADAIIFFVAEDAEDSYVGSIADLADGEEYDVMGVYDDGADGEDDILVIADVEGKVGKKANLAVITAVGESENEDAETILAIEAIVNGEEIAADTTADVYDEVATKLVGGKNVPYLTEGDIVKVKVGGNGVVTAIEVVYDFDEDVRSFAGAEEIDDYALAFAAGEYEADGDDEVIVGGQVEDYRDKSNTAVIDGEDYRLSQAANVIVIDANGRKLEVKKGSASSFKAFDALYKEDAVTVDVTVGNVIDDEYSVADALAVTDYVFVRKYDDRVVDVVIVKGPEDTRIR